MQVQNFNNQRNLTKLPSPKISKGPDAPQPDEPKEKFSGMDAAWTVAKSAATYGLFYAAGGGTMGGTMSFGAGWHGATGAIEGGKLAYNACKGAEEDGASVPRLATAGITTGGAILGGAVGAGFGALNGWATFTLATAMGGGIPGAVLAGAALGAGEAAYKLITQK